MTLMFSQEKNIWVEEETLQGHTDWVRDVAFAPSIGMPKTYLASGSQVSLCCKLCLTVG